MKKGKIIIILFIIIVFFVNPKTIGNIKAYVNKDKVKIIKEFNIDSNENIAILNYENNLILYDGKYLKAKSVTAVSRSINVSRSIIIQELIIGYHYLGAQLSHDLLHQCSINLWI